MTLENAVWGFALIMLGALIGVLALALFIGAREDGRDLITLAANADAAEQLDYLERSECNLYYNAQINAWGLLDGKDTLISAGHSVRAVLNRAREKDRGEHDEIDFMSAEIKRMAPA